MTNHIAHLRDALVPPYTATYDGGVLYMRRPGPGVAHFIRVIPDSAQQMKRTVDEANR